MQRAVIVDALRTPIGRLRGGLAGVRPDDLLAHVLQQLVARTGVAPDTVDEVVAGCANQAGEDNRNVARMAWLLAGFPAAVPAFTVNRLCASGLDAVAQAARGIWAGEYDTVIAGGVESMSRAPLVLSKGEQPWASGHRTAFDTSLGWRFPNPRLQQRFPLEAMGETAENIAAAYGIGRDVQDAFALQSHRRALAAWEAGHFAAEVVPVTCPTRAGPVVVARDEGPRADTSADKLARLAPVFRPGGSVTAGNASTLNDGAAALLIMSEKRARTLGMMPLATVVACASAGVDPTMMGIGPVPATRMVLQRAGWRLSDLDLVELNEAFAVQALAVMSDLGLGESQVNVSGGAVALGHPLGCSGARIATTLVHGMCRLDARRGLATLCVGVGQGVSVLFERTQP